MTPRPDGSTALTIVLEPAVANELRSLADEAHTSLSVYIGRRLRMIALHSLLSHGYAAPPPAVQYDATAEAVELAPELMP